MAENIDLNSIRTTEDIINVLSVLYFNLNEIERIYYDMFINTTPMDVTFQRYNNVGVLETITLPNRAKDIQSMLSGSGDPNGTIAAKSGAFYLDTANYDLYFKSSGSDSQGWVKVWTGLNLVDGINFISPTGNASQLTNLNMGNAGSGVLAVGRGGTGSTSITGIVMGNGSSAMTAARDGEDFMGPESMVGLVAYYPVASLPFGWLRCDGSAYSRTTYSRLFAKIGTTYGAGDGSTTFNIPNLMNYFIRGWDGSTAFDTVQNDQVGTHRHELSGDVGSESEHTHSRGTMNIQGTVKGNGHDSYMDTSGAFYKTGSGTGGMSAMDWNNPYLVFDASRNWTGVTSGGTAHTHSLSGLSTEYNVGNPSSPVETRVLNKMLVPVIKF